MGMASPDSSGIEWTAGKWLEDKAQAICFNFKIQFQNTISKINSNLKRI